MNILPPDRSDYLCPSTRDQFDRYLSITNTIVQASPRSLDCQDPGDLQFKRRPRKLRKTEQRAPPSTIPESNRLHATDDANKMRRRRILHTACATLTIQPTSIEDAAFLEELVKDADKCLDYAEWFQRYKTATIKRFVGGDGECDDETVRDVRHLLNNVSVHCHLEAMAPLFRDEATADGWHVPTSLSVVGRPMTREHLELALCFKRRGVYNPMHLRPCLGWHGDCLAVQIHGKRPFEMPPYRTLTDYLDNNDYHKHEVRWHWGQPMCVVCRIQSIHFPLLTRKGCEIKTDDFSMYHDLEFVDVLPKYLTRIPRPCRNVESGADVQTTTLAVLTFTEALQVTEEGYDVNNVCISRNCRGQ